MAQKVKRYTDFAIYFYWIQWFDITAFSSKAPKVKEVVEITASGPCRFVSKYYKLKYSNFENEFASIRAVMDQNVKQCTDFAMYFF